MIKESFLAFIHLSIVDTLTKVFFVVGLVAIYATILIS